MINPKKKVLFITFASAVLLGGFAYAKYKSSGNKGAQGCDATFARAQFEAACFVAGQMSNMQSLRSNDDAALASIRSKCKCISRRFNVEDQVAPPKCEFTVELVWALEREDNVRLACI